jgi:hypothetical protein
MAMNLKHWKLVTKAARPFLNKEISAETFRILDVNGALMDASASDSERPASAYFKAPQSFAPSPTIATIYNNLLQIIHEKVTSIIAR